MTSLEYLQSVLKGSLTTSGRFFEPLLTRFRGVCGLIFTTSIASSSDPIISTLSLTTSERFFEPQLTRFHGVLTRDLQFNFHLLLFQMQFLSRLSLTTIGRFFEPQLIRFCGVLIWDLQFNLHYTSNFSLLESEDDF